MRGSSLGQTIFPEFVKQRMCDYFLWTKWGPCTRELAWSCRSSSRESPRGTERPQQKEARGLLSSRRRRELSWALLQNLNAHVRETVPFFLLKNQKSTWGGITEVLRWKGTGSSQCWVVFTRGVFLCCHKMANTHYCFSNWAILWTSVNRSLQIIFDHHIKGSGSSLLKCTLKLFFN